MNSTSNLEIIETLVEEKQTTYTVSRKNPRLPWPSISTMAVFVSGGKFRKFREISDGSPNMKMIQIK